MSLSRKLLPHSAQKYWPIALLKGSCHSKLFNRFLMFTAVENTAIKNEQLLPERFPEGLWWCKLFFFLNIFRMAVMMNSLFFVQNAEGRLPTLPLQHPYHFLSSVYACCYHKKPTVSCCHTSCSEAGEQHNNKNYAHTYTKTTRKTITINAHTHTHTHTQTRKPPSKEWHLSTQCNSYSI